MTTVTDSDLKDIKDLITSQNQKLDQLIRDNTDIKVSIAEVKGDIKALSETVKGIDKRLEKAEAHEETLLKDVSDLKGAKSLIVPIIVAVTTSLLTLLIRAIPNP